MDTTSLTASIHCMVRQSSANAVPPTVLFLHFVVNPITCTKLCALCALKK